MKKLNYKSIMITLLLFFLASFIAISFIGIFISGIEEKNERDERQIKDKIQNIQKKTCNSITRHSFKYVTYTCEKEDEYVIYDVKAEQIAKRSKSELKLDEVKRVIEEKYAFFKDKPIEIGYGKKHAAYVVEVGSNMLILDFDSLEEVFHLEGE